MWGLTLPGRKRMPLDPERHDVDDQAANVGVRRDHLGSLLVRVLKLGDVLEGNEWRAVPHFATCPPLVAARDARAGRLKAQGVLPMPRRSGRAVAAAPAHAGAGPVVPLKPRRR